MIKTKENPSPILSDEQLMDLYWARDEKAIAETDRKYGKLIFRLAFRILHDSGDCEECRNDTYIGAWNAIPPARPPVLIAFLSQITRRVAINRYHAKNAKKHVPSELTLSAEELYESLHEDSFEREYETEEIGRLISEYVRGLSREKQLIFIGRYYMSESVSSLADKLGVSTRSIYRELQQIKEDLKQYLKENEVFI